MSEPSKLVGEVVLQICRGCGDPANTNEEGICCTEYGKPFAIEPVTYIPNQQYKDLEKAAKALLEKWRDRKLHPYDFDDLATTLEDND